MYAGRLAQKIPDSVQLYLKSTLL